MNYVVAGAAVVLLLGLFLYWLLVTTEGTYLGAPVVALLYDLTARRYDRIKQFDEGFEDQFLTYPLVAEVSRRIDPLVLDVATGTGRVSALLMGSPAFEGRVIGLDYSGAMLDQAALKTREFGDRVLYLRQVAEELHFQDEQFDLVTCLEALEFMSSPRRALEEMIRVARPGSLLLTTRRRGLVRRVMPGKSWSPDGYRALLTNLGLERIRMTPWQVDYDLVWAWKPSAQGPVADSTGKCDNGHEDRWWMRLIRCPQCGDRLLRRDGSGIVCQACSQRFPVARNGVVDLAHGRRSD